MTRVVRRNSIHDVLRRYVPFMVLQVSPIQHNSFVPIERRGPSGTVQLGSARNAVFREIGNEQSSGILDLAAMCRDNGPRNNN
jgi:hypothetical protein